MEDFEDSNFSSKQKENIRSTNIQEIDTTYQNNFKIWSPPALNGLKFGNCYSLSTTKGISLFNFDLQFHYQLETLENREIKGQESLSEDSEESDKHISQFLNPLPCAWSLIYENQKRFLAIYSDNGLVIYEASITAGSKSWKKFQIAKSQDFNELSQLEWSQLLITNNENQIFVFAGIEKEVVRFFTFNGQEIKYLSKYQSNNWISCLCWTDTSHEFIQTNKQNLAIGFSNGSVELIECVFQQEPQFNLKKRIFSNDWHHCFCLNWNMSISMLGIAKGKSIFVYSETKLYRLENAHDNTITSLIWMELFDVRTFFTCSFDGKIKSWVLDNGKDSIEPMNVIETVFRPFYGITFSPNYLFLIAVSKLEKNISQIHFFPLYNSNSVIRELTTAITSKRLSPPFNYWDITLFLNQETEFIDELYKPLLQTLLPANNTLPQSIESLQYLYSFLKCLNLTYPKEFSKNDVVTSIAFRIEAWNFYQCLKAFEQTSSFNNDSELCLNLMLDWVVLNISSCPSYLLDLAGKLSLKSFKQNIKDRIIQPREKCLLCCTSISLLDSQCSKKHIIERCGKTLLVLSGRKIREILNCNFCRRGFKDQTFEFMKKNNALCLYCGSCLKNIF